MQWMFNCVCRTRLTLDLHSRQEAQNSEKFKTFKWLILVRIICGDHLILLILLILRYVRFSTFYCVDHVFIGGRTGFESATFLVSEAGVETANEINQKLHFGW